MYNYRHSGPTNSGKTYNAIKALAETNGKGVYLGPLRLLAYEVHESLMSSGIPCNIFTGESKVFVEDALITSSTIELADYSSQYAVAVIDEAQFVCDKSRGNQWTKASNHTLFFNFQFLV